MASTNLDRKHTQVTVQRNAVVMMQIFVISHPMYLIPKTQNIIHVFPLFIMQYQYPKQMSVVGTTLATVVFMRTFISAELLALNQDMLVISKRFMSGDVNEIIQF